MAGRIWRNWKKWKPIRDKILLRDNYTCQYCRITLKQLQLLYRRETRLLIVHHIKGESDQPENLVTLCYTCHYRAAFVGSPEHKEFNRRIKNQGQ
jgi:5-methylcytosine-specific restriction endonuclease McrA